MVITGLTRNQFVRKHTRVRIPLSPPNAVKAAKNPQGNMFCGDFFNFIQGVYIMCFCCTECFFNDDIKNHIIDKNHIGNCDYCGAKGIFTISTEDIGMFFRKCISKAYEPLEAGTGAYYDSEDKEFYGPNGKSVTRYSILDIIECECVFEDEPNIRLLEDIISSSGPTLKEIQNGDFDIYSNIYEDAYVIIDDLYGTYGTKAFYNWEHFKFFVKHYNRFFDVIGYPNQVDSRKNLLDSLQPLMMEYDSIIPSNTKFYRARKNESHFNFNTININKELSPAPPKYAQTNRMSPAGISYLYVSDLSKTACSECRYKDEDVLIAEYVSKKDLQIIDFSKQVNIDNVGIFSDEYDHDIQWLNNFLKLFVDEISKPVDSTKNRDYEYVATQFIAEYIRCLGYDGIGFRSSIDDGVNYCFFCGPDIESCKDEYGIYDYDYNYNNYTILDSFLELFEIQTVSLVRVDNYGILSSPILTRHNL